MTRTCQLYEPDLAGAALDSREPIGDEAVRRHVAECPRCDRFLSELEAFAAVLGIAVNQVAPPRELKQRLLSATARDHTHASLHASIEEISR